VVIVSAGGEVNKMTFKCEKCGKKFIHILSSKKIIKCPWCEINRAKCEEEVSS
jgi:DNA-directed RNA polymerase subunit RPC12/RpoP